MLSEMGWVGCRTNIYDEAGGTPLGGWLHGLSGETVFVTSLERMSVKPGATVLLQVNGQQTTGWVNCIVENFPKAVRLGTDSVRNVNCWLYRFLFASNVMMSESKRPVRRSVLGFPVDLQDDNMGYSIQALTNDVSETGMGLLLTPGVDMDQEWSIRLPFSGTYIDLKAEMKYSKQVHENLSRAGFEIAPSDRISASLWRRLIQEMPCERSRELLGDPRQTA